MFKSKGVDVVAVIASNDAFVMNAWGKVNGVKGDGIVSTPCYMGEGPLLTGLQLFLSDTKTFFSKNYGWSTGTGDRK